MRCSCSTKPADRRSKITFGAGEYPPPSDCWPLLHRRSRLWHKKVDSPPWLASMQSSNACAARLQKNIATRSMFKGRKALLSSIPGVRGADPIGMHQTSADSCLANSSRPPVNRADDEVLDFQKNH